MKAKSFILITCLICVALSNFPCIADEIKTTFTFGRIEVLIYGEGEWAFLEKGFVLMEKDIVRMPPDSLIRLQSKDGLLPTLPGGREVLVGDLIAEAKLRKTMPRAKRINRSIEHYPMSDVLPVGHPTERINRTATDDKTRAAVVSNDELNALRMALDALPDEIARLIPELEVPANLPERETSNQKEKRYPYLTLDLARGLYNSLGELEASVLTDHDPTLLYVQLLRRSGIEADLVLSNNGKLLGAFNSGIPLALAKTVAANRALIHEQAQADTIWILVDAQPRKQNFTTAWYEGSEQIGD